MPEIQDIPTVGALLKYEAPNLYSRERVTVLAGQLLALGTVVGVVAASGKARALDPSATDGSQLAAGVLIEACNAHLGERTDGLMVARHAIVADAALVWPAGMTELERQLALAQLKALGVLVRRVA